MTMQKKHLKQAISGIESYLDNDGIYTGYRNKYEDNFSNNESELLKQVDPKLSILYQGVEHMLEELNPVGNHYGSVLNRNQHHQIEVLEDNGLIVLKSRNQGVGNINSGDIFLGVYQNEIKGFGVIDDFLDQYNTGNENLRIFGISEYTKLDESIERTFKFDRNQRLYFFN